MRGRSRMRRWALAFALAAAATPAMAGPYLFELLEIKAYRTGWDAMFKGEKNLPAWVIDFNKTLNGVSVPSADVDVGGQPYVYTTVCKPHDCGGNMIHVMFNQYEADTAFALLDDGSGRARFFGHPDKAMQAALKSQAGVR